MKADYAARLSARAASRDDITVLPGMEVSCLIPPGHAERVHLLVLFPEGTSADVIERIFAKQAELPGSAERTGEEVAKVDSLREWRELVEGQGGLLLLAHVDQHPRGHRAYVRRVRGETLEMFIDDGSDLEAQQKISNEYAEHLVEIAPAAVEVMKNSDRGHYIAFTTADGESHSYACVARSDHHNIADFADPGAFTHLKLSKVDFEYMRRALKFNATRIRFSDDIPEAPTPRLVGLRLASATGLFKEATIAFNENLNTLIGPRGSGKSTIVEALRYVLGQRPRLDAIGATASEDRSFASLALATQDANLTGTEIELIYEVAGERHLLTATFDAEAGVTTRVFLPDGTDMKVEPGALPAAYAARIFSWSELETLGRNPQLQRSVVDRLADALPARVEEQRIGLEDLAANRLQATALRDRLDGYLDAEEGLLGRYAELKQRYELLNTDEVAELFSGLDQLRERIRALRAVDEKLAALAEALMELEPDAPAEATLALLAAGSEELRAYWQEEITEKLDIDALGEQAKGQISQALAEVAGRRQTLAVEIQAQVELERQREEELREKTDADATSQVQSNQREAARQRYEVAAKLRDEYVETYDELANVLAERDGLLVARATSLSEIGSAREEIATSLNERLEEIEKPGEPGVRIEVELGADRSALTSWLESEFLNLDRGGHYKERRLAERLAQVDPVRIAEAIAGQVPEPLIGEGALKVEEAQKLIGAFKLWESDEAAVVTRVDERLIEILALQEQVAEDVVRILSDGTPVDRLSPGGRSSAMLPLIAMSDSAPLIIDQPEDNLDNRMVGITLSSILAELKERRQIIVTTHNPNIVVGGDAEQVVVLDAPSVDEAKVELTGSIDDDEVIDAVIRIMEGGKEAFEARERRYERHLNPT
jgi:ABC-type Mn2+/Zn2+ transport system ATPase subunit